MSNPDGSFRILVVRALQLGDLLCAVPALSALRQWKPAAHITLCGLPWSHWMVERYPDLLDDHLEFPGYPGIPEVAFSTTQWTEFQNSVRGNYDLAIQLHGSGTYINDFVRGLEARQTAGFYPVDQPELALDQGCPWPESGHEIERLKEVVVRLGAPNTSNRLELPVSYREIEEARRLLHSGEAGLHQSVANDADGHVAEQPIICMHTGGRSLTRRWPIQHYQSVATQLLERGYKVVLTGTLEEVHLAEQLQEGLAPRSPQCLNLVGRTTLDQLVGLIDQASLLVSNDTGISHIAAARQTPSVIVGLGSDLPRWLPLNRQLHKPVYVDVPCRPCYSADCPTQFECAQGVTPEMVLTAIEAQLAQYDFCHRNR